MPGTLDGVFRADMAIANQCWCNSGFEGVRFPTEVALSLIFNLRDVVRSRDEGSLGKLDVWRSIPDAPGLIGNENKYKKKILTKDRRFGDVGRL